MDGRNRQHASRRRVIHFSRMVFKYIMVQEKHRASPKFPGLRTGSSLPQNKVGIVHENEAIAFIDPTRSYEADSTRRTRTWVTFERRKCMIGSSNKQENQQLARQTLCLRSLRLRFLTGRRERQRCLESQYSGLDSKRPRNSSHLVSQAILPRCRFMTCESELTTFATMFF